MKSIPVLRIDPDLGSGIPAAERASAERACRAGVIELPRGSWDGDGGGGSPGFGLLVLTGHLCRRVVQNGHHGAELVGTGDLLRPWDRIGEWSSIPTGSEWAVINPTQLAVLDSDFALRSAPYPAIAESLVRRALLRSRYLAVLIAIIGQRTVETRLKMLFWHLADRFGQMRGDHVQIPVPLTHATLGELVGARRPSVSTALAQLRDRGVLARNPEGWHLSGPVPAELEQLHDSS